MGPFSNRAEILMLYTFLTDSLQFFRQHLVPLILISAGLGIATEALVLVLLPFASGSGFPWPVYLVQWIGGVWTSAAVILYLSEALAGRYLAPGKAITGAIPWLLPLAGVQALSGLAIAAGLILIVPGVYFAVKLALAGFYLLLDRQPVFEALRQAWRGSTGYGWTIFGGYALIYGVMLLGVQMLAVALGVSAESYGVVDSAISVLFKPVGALALVFGFRVFTEIRKPTAAAG